MDEVKLNMRDEIDFINDLAFYDCKKLEDFSIPSNIIRNHRMAFTACESIILKMFTV